MKKFLMRVVFIAFGVVMIFSPVRAGGGTAPSFAEHWDVVQVILGIAVIVVAWFLVHTLLVIEKSQGKLWTQMDEFRKDFYKLQGQHEARMKIGAHCTPVEPE